MALLSQRSQSNSNAAEAAGFLRTLSADFERVFGPTHPYSLQATSNPGDSDALFEVCDLAGAERASRAAVRRAKDLWQVLLGRVGDSANRRARRHALRRGGSRVRKPA
jgi:hypothetical protein